MADLGTFAGTNANTSTLVTYKFVNATANFVFAEPNGPYPATVKISGEFIVNTATQTIVGADIKLSGAPSFLSDWNGTYTTVGNSFWTSTPPQFIVTNSSGDQLRLAFDHANTAYSFSLNLAELADTQQWGPVYDVSVMGGVDQIGKGHQQSSQGPLTSLQDPPTMTTSTDVVINAVGKHELQANPGPTIREPGIPHQAALQLAQAHELQANPGPTIREPGIPHQAALQLAQAAASFVPTPLSAGTVHIDPQQQSLNAHTFLTTPHHG